MADGRTVTGRATRMALAMTALMGLSLAVTPVASASGSESTSTVSWRGEGTAPSGGSGLRLRSSRCDAQQTPYLVFVLSASKARSATLTVGANPPQTMTKGRGRSDDGVFTATYSPGASIDLAALLGNGTNVRATFTTSKDKRGRSSDESGRGRLVVTKGCLGATSVAAAITITSTAPASPVVGGTYTPTATSTSGGTVQISVDPASSAVCSITGGVVTFNAVGTCTLNFDDPGSGNFTAAPRQQQTMTVGLPPAVITVTSTAPASPVVGGTYTPTATSTSGGTVEITVDPASSAVCQLEKDGTVTFIGVGTCTLNFDDPGNADYAAAAQQQQIITVTEPTGLTIQFRPASDYQEVGYCPNGSDSTVCDPGSAPLYLGWKDFVSPGPYEHNIPLATLISENATTGMFDVGVLAPVLLPTGTKIGPGLGVSCLQRDSDTLVGTANGAVSLNWTGGGIAAGVNYYYYWYSGCSLDAGVTHAYFYAYTGDLPPLA